MAKKMTKKS